MSLKNKIFFFNTAVFLLAFFIFSFVALRGFSRSVLEDYKSSSVREIELIQNNLDTLLTSTEDYLRVLSTDNELQNALREYAEEENQNFLHEQKIRTALGKAVSNLIFPNTQLEGAVVWQDSKILYAGYSIEDQRVHDVISQKYLEKVEENQKPTWGNMIELKHTEGNISHVFPVSKIVVDKESGHRLGKVTLFLNEDQIEKIYQKSNVNKKNTYTIVNSDNKIISSVNKSLLEKDIRKLDIYDGKIADISNKTELTYRDDNYIYTLKNYDKMDWLVVSANNLEGFNETIRNIMLSVVLLLIVIGSIVFFGAYVISVKITKPLYSLITTMKVIESGDLKARNRHFKQKEIEVLSQEFNVLMDKVEESMHEIYTHQKSRRKSELQLLQAQIKPHFLYNTLETIASFIKLDYKDKSLQTLQNLSLFYRKSLNGGKEIISIKDELTIIENYLKIQEMRYGNYMEYHIDLEQELYDYKIPKLILQPLVENALYHGIKPSEEKAELIIRGYVKGHTIMIGVFDSGVGITNEQLSTIRKELNAPVNTTQYNSFGLYNVNERIRLFYGEEYGIEIESIYGEYTEITVCIPKVIKNEDMVAKDETIDRG